MPAAPLTQVVEALEGTGWAIEVLDPGWRVAWASGEMRLVMGAKEDADLGIGQHVLDSRRLEIYAGVSPPSREAWLIAHGPWMLHDGTTREELLELSEPRYHDGIRAMEPRRAPLRWSFSLDAGELGVVRILGERLIGEDGELLGTVFVYGSTLPASIAAYVTQGDIGMFRRMAELITPGRRQAAVLFADVEGSTDRSRRLPSARWFELVRELNTAMDAAILHGDGIVGKHAGDGVSAFFLADQVGSASSAARAAIQAARDIATTAERLDGDFRLKIGVHWGATLYMGQIATSGRLEVTALGDEVNECARLQEAALAGELLASKPLLERLEPDDAAALRVDPHALTYVLVGELPSASEKARRDAGTLPVAALPAR